MPNFMIKPLIFKKIIKYSAYSLTIYAIFIFYITLDGSRDKLLYLQNKFDLKNDCCQVAGQNFKMPTSWIYIYKSTQGAYFSWAYGILPIIKKIETNSWVFFDTKTKSYISMHEMNKPGYFDYPEKKCASKACKFYIIEKNNLIPAYLFPSEIPRPRESFGYKDLPLPQTDWMIFIPSYKIVLGYECNGEVTNCYESNSLFW